MNNCFLCGIRYPKVMENGTQKNVTEQYLLSLQKRLLYLMARPICLDFILQPNVAPAETPIAPSKLILFSIKTSITPAVNIPRIAPPSIIKPYLFIYSPLNLHKSGSGQKRIYRQSPQLLLYKYQQKSYR